MSTQDARGLRRGMWSVVSCIVAAGLVACGGGGTRPGEPPGPAPARRLTPTQPDPVRLYRQMGLLAAGGELPFVGRVGFLASPFPDSTFMVFAISMPSRALTFSREGDQYRAAYVVEIVLRQGPGGERVVRKVDAHESVRVISFKETTRSDESVIFQQVLSIPPGQYDLSVQLRDEVSAKVNTLEAVATVPRLAGGGVSTPLPVYEITPRSSLDSLPHLIPTPRATATFGQDSVLPVYVEAYAPAGGTPAGGTPAPALPVSIWVHGETNSSVFWSDTAALARRGSLYEGVVNVPVSRIGIGAATVVVARRDRPDTMRAPVFVSFGEDLPVASFAEMLTYLRYFASSQRLQGLRDAPPERRAEAWAQFLRETDPNPSTPQHEGLRDYFNRIAQANSRFREEGMQGWLTDRGRVLVALGNPDQIWEPNRNDLNQRGRTQVWDYTHYRLQVVFVDQTGFGRWRMTIPSEVEFETVVRRELGAVGR